MTLTTDYNRFRRLQFELGAIPMLFAFLAEL